MRDGVASASEVADGRGRSPATSAGERVRRFAFGFANLPLGWWELLSRTVKEFVADNGLGLAAQLAYYFFFSLFPAVLVGIAFASFFPLEHFVDRMVATLGGVVPGDIIGIVQDQIRKISEGNNGGHPDLRRPRRALEQLGGGHGADRRAEPRLRHRGGAPLVEGAAPVAGPDPRRWRPSS